MVIQYVVVSLMKDIVAVTLDKEGEMNIGYITRKDSLTSDLANAYIEALRKHVNK